MSDGWQHQPENWWRVAAIVLGCIVVVAGVVLYGERTANRDLRESIANLEESVSASRAESDEIREGLVEAEAGLRRSRIDLERAQDRALVVAGLVDDLGAVLGGFGGDGSEVDIAIRELVEQIVRDLAGDIGGESGSPGRGP